MEQDTFVMWLLKHILGIMGEVKGNMANVHFMWKHLSARKEHKKFNASK